VPTGRCRKLADLHLHSEKCDLGHSKGIEFHYVQPRPGQTFGQVSQSLPRSA
jgi:hypothetical protein